MPPEDNDNQEILKLEPLPPLDEIEIEEDDLNFDKEGIEIESKTPKLKQIVLRKQKSLRKNAGTLYSLYSKPSEFGVMNPIEEVDESIEEKSDESFLMLMGSPPNNTRKVLDVTQDINESDLDNSLNSNSWSSDGDDNSEELQKFVSYSPEK